MVPVHALAGDSLCGTECGIRFGGLAHISPRGLPISSLDGLLSNLLRRPGLRAYIRCLADWATTNEFLSLEVVHVLPLSSDLGLVSLDWVGKQAILVGDFGLQAMLEVLGPVRKGVCQPTDQPDDGARRSLARYTRTAAGCSGEHGSKNVGQAGWAQLVRAAAPDPVRPLSAEDHNACRGCLLIAVGGAPAIVQHTSRDSRAREKVPRSTRGRWTAHAIAAQHTLSRLFTTNHLCLDCH